MYIPKKKPYCPPGRPPRFEDVVFAKVPLDNGEMIELKMDIYQDLNQKEAGPCIVYFFGGAWMWGDYKQQKNKAVYFNDMLKFVDEGYTIVSPSYRVVGDAIFPACVHDAKGAIRFLKANGEKYHIDEEKIGVLGNSAGAHLAAMVALSANDASVEGDVGGNLDYSSKVAAAALFYTPADLVESAVAHAAALGELDLTGTEIDDVAVKAQDVEAAILGYVGEGRNVTRLAAVIEAGDETDPDWAYVEMAKKYSPISYVSEDVAPTLLLHGGHDTTVPIEQSEKLYRALVAAEAEVMYFSNAYAGHGPSMGPEGDGLAYQFLKSRLS